LTRFLGYEHEAGLASETLDKVLDKAMRTQKFDRKPLPKKVEMLYESVLERKANSSP
jgi:hypothetical protein